MTQAHDFSLIDDSSYYASSLALKSLDTEGIFEGYASTHHTDQHNDVLKPGAFRRTLAVWRKKQKWPFLLWQHQMTSPIGTFVDVVEKEDGLYVKGRLLLKVQRAYEAYVLLKNGVINGLSIGFRPVTSRFNKMLNVREFFQVELMEISIVTVPANPYARVSRVKHGM